MTEQEVEAVVAIAYEVLDRRQARLAGDLNDARRALAEAEAAVSRALRALGAPTPVSPVSPLPRRRP